MVAYSFKQRFVEPIRAGLGTASEPHARPKLQTIRADRRRHARPGEQLQLYRGMRTKACFLIGRAVCRDARPIYIEIECPLVAIGDGAERRLITVRSELDIFAQEDGFGSYEEFALFWYENHHPTMNDFRGVLIRWAPLPKEES
jgi:hypothetical protein